MEACVKSRHGKHDRGPKKFLLVVGRPALSTRLAAWAIEDSQERSWTLNVGSERHKCSGDRPSLK
jgi:hypothetical protein